MGVSAYSHCHAMAGFIRTFQTNTEKLNGLVIYVIGFFGIYTEPLCFEKNQNFGYVTNTSKITMFSEHLKDDTLIKYNFVNLLKVKNDYSYGEHLCMEDAKYSTRFCFACFQICR